jgi:NitT/TauT family transport system permease protein
MMAAPQPISVVKRGRPSLWDAVAVLLVLGALAFLAQASRDVLQPLPAAGFATVTLDARMLPEYAARTTARMLAAMILSLIFTFTYATWAAKSRRAAVVLIPLLDILQSVPILGFISVSVVFFMSLAPGKVLGAELAAIFAIFTSQAWNMAFSFYQSLRTVPEELVEAALLPPWRLDALLAPRGAVCHAPADLEHDDVHVGRVVLRGRVGGDQRRRHDRCAARHRLLYRARHRAARP